MGFRSTIATCLVCAVAWVHGATTGIAMGDRLLKRFFYLSLFAMLALMVMWQNSVTRRTGASLLFMLSAAYVMALLSAVNSFRVPQDAPPLPDIGHDLAPYLKDADLPILGHVDGHTVPDVVITCVVGATAAFVGTHPKRGLILRRFFVIYGVTMMARSVCVCLTTLPYATTAMCTKPATRAAAAKQHAASAAGGSDGLELRLVMSRALSMVLPVGEMNCGDLLFSGHTSVLVLCAMVWHTYCTWLLPAPTQNVVPPGSFFFLLWL